METDIHLTIEEAYAAMYAYLFKVYERTKSDDLGGMLGDMSTLDDGGTADPAMWHDWIECVAQARKQKIDTRLNFQ